PFNRSEAGRELFLRHLETSARAIQEGRGPNPPSAPLVDAIQTALAGAARGEADDALVALALTAPAIDAVAERLPWADYASSHAAREEPLHATGRALHATLTDLDDTLTTRLGSGPYVFTPEAVGRRSLRNLVVSLLSRVDAQAASRHLARATNMTDTQ